MGRHTSHSLSPEEAKAQLRAAARRVSATHWIARHRWSVLAAALVGGFIAGRVGVPKTAGAILIRHILPSLPAMLWRKAREK